MCYSFKELSSLESGARVYEQVLTTKAAAAGKGAGGEHGRWLPEVRTEGVLHHAAGGVLLAKSGARCHGL